MGTVNYGDQHVAFDYKAPGKASEFNKLNYEILPVGIYSGGLLTRIDTVTVQISQLTCFIEDTITGIGVRIATNSTINTTVAPSTPYLIIRYGFSNVENNYADIIAVDYASIDPKDIIIGRCAYNASNELQSTFDYTRRTVSSLQDLDDKHLNLKVVPTESPSNTVSVSAGEVLVLNNPYTFGGGTTDTISDTVDGRIDIVYIDDFGVLQVLEGTDNASPVQPDFPSRGHALAKITRSGGVHTVVRGDQIEMFDFDGVSGGASSGGGGGSSIEATTGESIDAGELVYFASDGKLYLADNREFEKSIVAGFALETAGPDSLITVGKLGLIEEFSGLTAGAERYLGHSGLMITLGAIDIAEYKVHVGTCVDATTIDAFVQLPEPTRNQDDGNPVGSIKYFSTYKDRSGYGYRPFCFGEDALFSKANFPALYAEVGDIYEAQHIAAGDTASDGDHFYGVPIPGSYDRVGVPDIELDASAEFNTYYLPTGLVGNPIDTALSMRNGSKWILDAKDATIPTGLTDGETYYISRTESGGTAYIGFYLNEAEAVAKSVEIDLGTAGSGTFRLTQEGIVLDDAMQQITGSAGTYESRYQNFANLSGALGGEDTGHRANGGTSYEDSGFKTLTFDSANSPDARTTNETRPKTNISFGYIKVEHVTTAGEPISALRYDTGWVANSDWTSATFPVVHNLSTNLSDMLVRIFMSTDGTENNSFELGGIDKSDASTSRADGYEAQQVDNNNIQIRTGSTGVTYAGGRLTTESYYYKVVITKPNLVATYADTSFRKVFNITTGDNQTFTLPDASTQLTEYNIKRTGAGAGTVTVNHSGSDTIEGSSSPYIMRGDETLRIIPNGTNWAIVSTNEKRVCKAWANFDGTGTPSFRDSFNFSSISTSGEGKFELTFINPMKDANFAVSVWGGGSSGGFGTRVETAPTATTVYISTFNAGQTAYLDHPNVYVQVFGS